MGRHNSIGFIRLVAALLVIVGHSFPYGGYGSDPLIAATGNQLAIGRFPVDIFFALSGFLIAMSYANASSAAVFAWHRFLRIYPALIVCLLVTGLAVAPVFGDGPSLWYIVRNVTLIVPISDSIPGLWVDGPGHGSVNSSLWTLPWEMRAYAIIFVLGVLGLLRKVWVVAALFFLSWAVFAVQIFTHPGLETGPAVTSGFRLITFFLAGTLFYLLRHRIRLRLGWFLASLALMLAATVVGTVWAHYSAGVFYALSPIPLTYAVFWLATRLPFERVNADYDVSYGLYIYGTLTLNVYANMALDLPWAPYLALTVVSALCLAVASWYLVEKPALSLKDLRFGGGKIYRAERRAEPRVKVGVGSAADV